MANKPKTSPSKEELRAAVKLHRCRRADEMTDGELKIMGFPLTYCRPDSSFIYDRAYELMADAFCAGMSLKDIE
jgi:hypothetical protein